MSPDGLQSFLSTRPIAPPGVTYVTVAYGFFCGDVSSACIGKKLYFCTHSTESVQPADRGSFCQETRL